MRTKVAFNFVYNVALTKLIEIYRRHITTAVNTNKHIV